MAALRYRLDDAEAGVRRADDQFRALAVHTTELVQALMAQVAEAEGRLAELEIDRSGFLEAMRRAVPRDEADQRTWSVDEAVAHWRRRLAEGSVGASPAARRGPVARVATDVGALLLPGHDEVMLSFLRQHGEWERQESDQLRSRLRPGMTFVDIGAHVGYMSLVASAAVGSSGRGFAFEPEPGNFRLLRANLANHGVNHVELVPAAAWRESGPLSLSLCTDNTGDHRAYSIPGRAAIDVLGLALDDVLPADVRVDVVKVDAQATDDIAIQGMERTLARSRPVLLVEFWPEGIRDRGDAPATVLEYYRDLGYELGVLGDVGVSAAASVNAVIEAAESSETSFCTLVLTPAA